MRRGFLCVLPIVALLEGCASISGGVAASTVPLEPGSYKEIKEVRGTDCVYYLFGVIPLSAGNTTKEAVANALSQAPGATALVNVTVDTYTEFWVVVALACTQVEGMAVAPK